MSDRPSDGMDIDELRDEFDWITEFQSRMAERIRGDADVHNLVDYVGKLEAENAMLRELVQDVMPIVCNGCHERLCEMPKVEHPFVTCSFADRMRELGVEV